MLENIYYSELQEKLGKDKESPPDSNTSNTTTTTATQARRRRYTGLDVNPDHLQQLMDMGFPLEQAMDALYHSTTIEQATDFLLSNPLPALLSSLRPANVSFNCQLF